MEIKVLKEKPIHLIIKKTNKELMNAIRRIGSYGIPIFAIEDITIYENNSKMFDEMLAHRLAQIPLSQEKNLSEKEKASFSLKKEGPYKVTSGDIKSLNPNIKVIDKDIPIVKLWKGEKIKLEMTAIPGMGKEHVKWSPGIISFSKTANLLFDAKKCNLCKECIKSCPMHILKLDGKKITMIEKEKCTLCNKCRDKCKEEAIEVIEGKDFNLFVESSNGLSEKEILVRAAKEIINKVNELKKSLKKL